MAWLSVWSEVQTCIWPSCCHCHSLSLASVKSRLVLPFWYLLTWVVPEKGPLNGCVCVCVCVCVWFLSVIGLRVKPSGCANIFVRLSRASRVDSRLTDAPLVENFRLRHWLSKLDRRWALLPTRSILMSCRDFLSPEFGTKNTEASLFLRYPNFLTTHCGTGPSLRRSRLDPSRRFGTMPTPAGDRQTYGLRPTDSTVNPKCRNYSRDPDHAPFRNFSWAWWDWLWST